MSGERGKIFSDLFHSGRHDDGMRFFWEHIGDCGDLARAAYACARHSRDKGDLAVAREYYAACARAADMFDAVREHLGWNIEPVRFWSGRSDEPRDAHIGPFASMAEARAIAPYQEDITADMIESLAGVDDGSHRESGNHATEAVLASLARASAERAAPDVFRVCDIGGAFGWIGMEFRKTMDAGLALRWTVVDRPLFVAEARARVKAGWIEYADRIPDAGPGFYDAVLLSNVLQVLDEPKRMFDAVVALKPRFVIVERFPCSESDRDMPCAYYHGLSVIPFWVFSVGGWIGRFLKDFDILESRKYPGTRKALIRRDRSFVTGHVETGFLMRLRDSGASDQERTSRMITA